MEARPLRILAAVLLLAACSDSGDGQGQALASDASAAASGSTVPADVVGEGSSEDPQGLGPPSLEPPSSGEQPSRLDARPPVPPLDLSKVEIRLDRTECYGWCPNYSVVIAGNGHVTYTGRTFVREIGEREGTISEVAVRELLAGFDRSRFFELEDEYTQSVTDLDSAILTLTVGGRSKKVLNYWVGADHEWGLDAPDREIHIALDSIALAIDQAVGVEHWIGTPEEREATRGKFPDGSPGRMGPK